MKTTTRKTSQRSKAAVEQCIEAPQAASKRGRPKKQLTAEELAQKSKPKLTLDQKQAMKLQRQKEREAAKQGKVPANKSRFYCTSKQLQEELIRWRDSSKKIEDRVISEELGKMFLAIGNKLLNHSSFRNYPKELKEDMLMFGIEKLIKGLKHYNFAFSNSFAYCTQAFWNAYLTVISRHYKQQNIKKDLMAKLAQELQTYTGINPASSLSKCLKSYLGNDIDE